MDVVLKNKLNYKHMRCYALTLNTRSFKFMPHFSFHYLQFKITTDYKIQSIVPSHPIT